MCLNQSRFYTIQYWVLSWQSLPVRDVILQYIFHSGNWHTVNGLLCFVVLNILFQWIQRHYGHRTIIGLTVKQPEEYGWTDLLKSVKQPICYGTYCKCRLYMYGQRRKHNVVHVGAFETVHQTASASNTYLHFLYKMSQLYVILNHRSPWWYLKWSKPPGDNFMAASDSNEWHHSEVCNMRPQFV